MNFAAVTQEQWPPYAAWHLSDSRGRGKTRGIGMVGEAETKWVIVTVDGVWGPNFQMPRTLHYPAFGKLNKLIPNYASFSHF